MDEVQQPAVQPEKRDVSKQTLVVLVILAVVVSLLGTFTVLRETSGINKQVVYNGGGGDSARGQASITILNPNEPSAPNVDTATGYVILRIS
jgi:hypothetical protein